MKKLIGYILIGILIALFFMGVGIIFYETWIRTAFHDSTYIGINSTVWVN
jgi:hypothetical protein